MVVGVGGSQFAIDQVAIGISLKVIPLIETVYLEAPDFSVFLTDIPVAQVLGVTELLDNRFVVGDIELTLDTQSVGKAVVIVDRELPSLCTELTIVSLRCAGAISDGVHTVGRHDHVLRVSLIPVEGYSQFVVEQTEVDTNTERLDLLPTDRSGNGRWGVDIEHSCTVTTNPTAEACAHRGDIE